MGSNKLLIMDLKDKNTPKVPPVRINKDGTVTITITNSNPTIFGRRVAKNDQQDNSDCLNPNGLIAWGHDFE